MNELITTEAYKGQEKILVAVDCIIFGFDSKRLKLLLFKRKVEPMKGAWSLIGTFVQPNQTLEDAANQVLVDATGLTANYLDELKTYSALDRDPGKRVISVAYYSLIRLNEYEIQKVEEYDAHWFDLDAIPDLIFDHEIMVSDAIEKLRKKTRYQPIGFELLPKEFTIPQLQLLYERIYRRKLDDRNFRKKVISFDILTNTGEKDKSGSKKGAFLYRFNKEKYDSFLAKGFSFEL
jgi:ADP-ribose pyrophosphatase YjhB (NUDIX family)